MTFALSVVWVSALLLFVVVTALRERSALGVIIAIQAAYMLLGYVVRPVFVCIMQPAVQRGDRLADIRYVHNGYVASFESIMPTVLIGTITFTLAALSILRLDARRSLLRSGRIRIPRVVDSGLLLVVFGWIFRIGSLGSDSGVLETFSYVASVGVGFIILDTSREQLRKSIRILGTLVVSELCWSVLSASKAPIFALALYLIVSFGGRAVMSRRFVATALGVVAALALLFPIIQSAKVVQGTLEDNSSVISSYPYSVRWMVPLLTRFDLSSATFDAVQAGSGSWITPADAAKKSFESLLPSVLVGERENVGRKWANEVRAITVANSNTGVHLAEGPIAEGYILGGMLGVVVEVALISLATFLVAQGLSSRRCLLRALSVFMMTQPYIFERGVIAAFEALGKGLQVAFLVASLLALNGLASRAATRNGSSASSAGSLAQVG